MVFANSKADPLSANLLGTEQTATRLDLQLFAGNYLGLPEPGDAPAGDEGDGGSAEEGTPNTPEVAGTGTAPQSTAQTQQGETPAQTQVTGQSGDVSTPHAGNDPLAKFRNPDGSLNADLLANGYVNVNKERGRLANELGKARQPQAQPVQTQPVQTPQGQPEDGMTDEERRAEINRQFVREMAVDPTAAVENLFRKLAAPIMQPYYQERIDQALKNEANDNFWTKPEFANIPETLQQRMGEVFMANRDYLTQEHPQFRGTGLTLMPPSKQLEFCYYIAKGMSADQALDQVVAATADAVTRGESEKVSAGISGSAAPPSQQKADVDPVEAELERIRSRRSSNYLGL